MPLFIVILGILMWCDVTNAAKQNAPALLEGLSAQEIREIGQKVTHNECGGDVEKFTSWLNGEKWASLGAIHALWYPEGVEQTFKETFPKLVRFIKAHGKKVPSIALRRYCPWKTQAEFMAALNSPEMKELRQFLKDTVDLQIAFAIQRLKKSLPRLLDVIKNESQKNHIKQQFYRVLHSKNGVYVLVDYLNFKGEGSGPASSYNGYRWGLLQVLEGMQGTERGAQALKDFRESAKKVLQRRVQNAPPGHNESRWLPGWYNRIATYV